MTGLLGATYGKGGLPSLHAVASLTLDELGQVLREMVGQDAQLHLRAEGGRWHAVAGGGSLYGTGTGDTPDVAVTLALAYLGARL